MFHPIIPPTSLQDFKARLHGELISPGDEGYNNARRVWNGTIDKYPALIARCTNASDVISCIEFARSLHLPTAIRSGGHSHAGHGLCDDGLVIDLSPMKGLLVDPNKQTVRAEPGLMLGEFLGKTQLLGLTTPTGIFSNVGLSGLTLGGGIGWLTGKHGLTIDNLLSVEIVTADGSLLTANTRENPDLFWAIRGGGGNFGVVTAFEFQLHPIAQVLAGTVIHPMTRAREVLRFYREYTQSCPDELTVHVALVTKQNGQPLIILHACYCGELSEGERVLAKLRTFGPPLVDLIRPMTILQACSLFDASSPPGRQYCYKAETILNLSDEVIDTILAYGETRTSPFSVAVLQHVHGIATRVDPSATAFALRHDHYILEMIAQWEQGEAEPHKEWAYSFWAAIKPFVQEGVYVNFLGEEGEPRVQASYGSNYERLVRIKKTYDPTNFFHLNQNINPILQS
jgi:FAD/FMN-containing dehydrogenase